MLDIKFIRDNIDIVKDAARKKRITVDLDRLVALDDERKRLQQASELCRARQNDASINIGRAASEDERRGMIESMKVVKEELSAIEDKTKVVMKEWQNIMVQVPNVPDMSVPEGGDDAANVEVRTWGTPTQFSFAPKSHVDLALSLGLADFDRGAKVSGFRGYFLTGDGVRLTFALWQFVLNHFTQKGGYTPMLVPSLVRREPFIGTGYLPQGEEDLYKTQDGDFLAGTAEVAMMSFFMDEVLEEKSLPKKFLAFSPCFRREAGSHGKDTKGLVRVHEFYKLEQVILCEANHQTSVALHEELTANAEELLQLLKLPYRVVLNCGGDIGLGQVKKYDLEAWVPSEKKYRETHSASYFHDFQTRRLNIRYRDAEGKMRFVHSLNNTALAGPRILVPLLENYQNEDGSVTVPEILRPYMGKEKLESRK